MREEVTVTAEDKRRRKVKRVRKVPATSPAGDNQPRDRGEDHRDFDGDEAEMYRFVTVPPMDGGPGPARGASPMAEQVSELFHEFRSDVASDEESFHKFMLWASTTDEVMFEDLLIATKSVYAIMGQPLPCSKATWAELVDIANLVEVSKVAGSELDSALEVFSKAYDLYKAEVPRFDEARDAAERAPYERTTEDITAGDELAGEVDRWDKLVDDTRSQINSTKAGLDEMMEELTPLKEEREQALSRLRVLEKDTKRHQARLERYQRGRISDAKAEEISNLERELVAIGDEVAEWRSRLGIAQERIDKSIGLFAEKRVQFLHIKAEVNSLIGSLPSPERTTVREALAGEMQDLKEVMEETDEWMAQLTSDDTSKAGDSTSIIDGPPPVGDVARYRVESISRELVERPPKATGQVPDEPPVVFMDTEVRRMLAELPIERPPEEELILRIDSLQQELMNRENTILQLEHTIEELMEGEPDSTTAIELERNKYKLEVDKIQEELVESQGLLGQYLQVIRDLESKMVAKDRDLDETMRLNRQKTAELRKKESELEALERELLERQEEFRQEKQELMDRETRLNAQVSEREGQEREMAKKDLTLELRNEQIRKKMDRLTARELELQRVASNNREMEEMLALKERELQNLKTELDVREEELRHRETSIEERTEELKRLQSDVTKLEHRVRSRDETLRRREAHQEEEEIRIGNLEAFIAEREVQIRDREEELNLQETKVESTVSTLDSQRDQVESDRRQVSLQRQEVDRLRIAMDQRHEELLRREDSLHLREDTVRERERAVQLREERLEMERDGLARLRHESDQVEAKWSAREKNLLERLDAFNTEKEELMGDWKTSKARVRELEQGKVDLMARLMAAENSLMDKDGEILEIARELEAAQGREEGITVDLADGVRTTLLRIRDDVERQRIIMDDLAERNSKVEERERQLVEMEEILNKERGRVRELVAEQERGQTDIKEAMDQLAERTTCTDELETSLTEREAKLATLEEAVSAREEAVRIRERELEHLTTAELAEARAVDREEELAQLQRELETRTTELESREEDLEDQLHHLREEEMELERRKADLLMAREGMLKVAEGKEMKPLARLKCKACDTIIPIYTEERPLQIVCPQCGKMGILK